MQYRIAALFAVTAAAVPVSLNSDNAVVPRAEADGIGNLGLGANVAGDGTTTGVANAKREESDFIEDYSNLASDFVNAFSKRSDEDLIGNAGIAANVAGDGTTTGVANAKRSEEVSVGGDSVGIPVLDPNI